MNIGAFILLSIGLLLFLLAFIALHSQVRELEYRLDRLHDRDLKTRRAPLERLNQQAERPADYWSKRMLDEDPKKVLEDIAKEYGIDLAEKPKC
jgi:hypothetical protein